VKITSYLEKLYEYMSVDFVLII